MREISLALSSLSHIWSNFYTCSVISYWIGVNKISIDGFVSIVWINSNRDRGHVNFTCKIVRGTRKESKNILFDIIELKMYIAKIFTCTDVAQSVINWIQ